MTPGADGVGAVGRYGSAQALAERVPRLGQVLEPGDDAAVAGGDLDRGAADLAEVDGAEGVELAALAADQEAAGALAEERLLGAVAALAQVLQVDPAAVATGDRRLGEGDGEAAVGDVVG